jgi:hypothetical protein
MSMNIFARSIFSTDLDTASISFKVVLVPRGKQKPRLLRWRLFEPFMGYIYKQDVKY